MLFSNVQNVSKSLDIRIEWGQEKFVCFHSERIEFIFYFQQIN